jgi:hypothetical protein
MVVPSVSELSEFHRFVSDKVADGGASSSPEQVLDEWRMLHPDPASAEDDMAAIDEAVADLAKGEVGVLFEEFDVEFRARHGLPGKS